MVIKKKKKEKKKGNHQSKDWCPLYQDSLYVVVLSFH